MKKIILTLCIFHLALSFSYAQSGSLDNTFGTGGKVTTAFGSGWGNEGRSVVIQSDGKIVVAGSCNFGSNYSFALIRYNTSGTLDNTFGSGGKVSTDFGTAIPDGATSVVLQSDGKIVVAGHSNGDFAVARYNSNGSLDSTFDFDGKVITDFGGTNDYALSVAIQSDGKIVASGSSNFGSSYDFAVARYNSDGSLDNTFGSGGKITTDFVGTNDLSHSMALQNDGKIVVAGYGDFGGGGNYDYTLVRYNSNGSLDNTFDFDGKVTTDFGGANDEALSVAIQNDGKIVVSGSSNFGSSYDFAVSRYNSDGSLDNTFGSSGKITTDFVGTNDLSNSMALQSDGKIVVAGYSFNGTDDDFSLVRYNSDGSVDNTFDTDGKLTTDFGLTDRGVSVAIQSDGKIVVAGYSEQLSFSFSEFAVARYNNSILSSIEESVNNKELEVNIYPNPSSGIFTVNLKNKTTKTDICIHDVLGNCVLDKVSVKNINPEIDLSSQPKGVYFMEIISEGEKAVKKIVLQ